MLLSGSIGEVCPMIAKKVARVQSFSKSISKVHSKRMLIKQKKIFLEI
jgi:hypothetical protein